MVVPDFHPGFKFEVVVDGEPLKEYDDKNEEVKAREVSEYKASRTVSKYIEAVTGKEFGIRLSVGKPYEMDCSSLSFKVLIDGKVVERQILRSSLYEPDIGPWVTLVEGALSQNVDEATLTPFKFKNFLISDL